MSLLTDPSTYSYFFGQAGATAAITLSCIGAAYGTAKAGTAIASVSVISPSTVMRSLVPVIMAGVLSILGLIISIFINSSMDAHKPYPLFSGAMHLAAGVSMGMCCVASGYTVGVVGDAGSRALVKQAKIFTGYVMILIFAEVLGLFGFLIAIIINNVARV